MPYQIELAEMKATMTAVIRSRVAPQELARFVPAACGEVWSFIRTGELRGPGRHLALYLDDGLVEVGAEVTEPFTGNERIQCSLLPGGRVAMTAHFGPYGRLGGAHAAIREWCGEHGLRRAGPFWEVYGHWEESWDRDPSKIRTDVFHLLENATG